MVWHINYFRILATTKASTQASGTQAKGKLSVIIEDYSSHSSETSSQSTSEAFAFMEGFGNMNLNAGFPTMDVALLGYDTRLVFVRENWLGAKLYSDHFNRIVVKIEDIPTPTEAEVWVRSQGDQYMSIMGIRYLLTLEYENMGCKRQAACTTSCLHILRTNVWNAILEYGG